MSGALRRLKLEGEVRFLRRLADEAEAEGKQREAAELRQRAAGRESMVVPFEGA